MLYLILYTNNVAWFQHWYIT